MIPITTTGLTPRGISMVTRNTRRWTATVVMAMVLGVVGVPAQAAVVPSAKIVDSGCSSQTKKMKWIGSDSKDRYSFPRPQGSVYVCFEVYKLSDKNPKADYYAVVARSVWSSFSGTPTFEAYAYQTISSSSRSVSNYYAATNSFTASKSCSDPVSISASVPGLPISVGVKPKICKGYKVTRTVYDDHQATWSVQKAGGLRTLETSYSQEVKQGAKPQYTVRFSIPQYKWVEATPRDYTVKRFKVVTFHSDRR